ncbi:uncharacterized protein [Notothenia coriiceps]|uniref:MADF domain-containing protein n=1 Tax=Notothenia coriiceps TaxID=8208 RepID=A0A6I9PRT9_9TELE|nr:PREDICTED: uncharacterized protein LOC104963545 [Notothenia coriiceps]
MGPAPRGQLCTEKKYSNRVVKTGLWREIETQLGFSEKELRKKWDSLRTEYTRYRKLAWKESTSNLPITERPEAAESPPGGTSSGTSNETSTSTTEEPFNFDAEPCTPLLESTICTTPAPLRERPSTLSTGRPPAKRRMMQDSQEDSAVEALKTMPAEIKLRLAELAPSGPDDEIAAHCKVFEHRLRLMTPHQMQRFLNQMQNTFFEYLNETTFFSL